MSVSLPMSRLKLILLSALLFVFAAQNAGAICTFDLRVLQVSGGGGSLQNSKTVSVGPGSVVTFGLYANVTGLNATIDETFQSALATVATFSGQPTKNIRGNLSSVSIDPNFQTGAFFSGAVVDLNGDGDLDVGGPPTGATSVTGNFINARAASQIGALPGVSTDILSPTAVGRSFLFGTVTFTVQSIVDPGGPGISANFLIPTIGGAVFNAQRASYATDGTTKNGGTAAAPTVFAGSPVQILVASFPNAEIAVEQPVDVNLPDGGSKSFGNVPVNASTSLVFTIKNFGNQNLTGLGISVDGPDASMFTITANPTAPVSGPSGSTTFTVQFTPASGGNKTAQIHIANNDPNENPFDLTLSGTGTIPGSVDPVFNPNVVGSYIAATAVQPDGKILVAGSFTMVGSQMRNSIARLNADGSVESTATFNPGTGADFDVTCITVQADGKILLGGGFGTVNGQPRNRIARLNGQGGVESTATFNVGTGPNDFIYNVLVQPDGKILIAGDFTSVNGAVRNRIARLTANGGVEGTATFNAGTGANGTVSSIALQADGKIVLAGSFTSVDGQPRNRIARLNADGTLEGTATFNAGTGVDGDIYAVAIQPDGGILLAGDFANVNGQPRARVARLHSDGSVETTATFNVGTGADAAIYSVALQADGRILLAGDFTSVNGEARNRIARLSGDGSVDDASSLHLGTGADATIVSVALQADGYILLGGSFGNVDGQTRSHLARLVNGSAPQSLTIPTIARAQWARSGSTPEVDQVTFELSTNSGGSWSTLGPGTRIAGGWERTGLNLPAAGSIRARGRTVSSGQNGSSGLIEEVAAFTFDLTALPPTLTSPASDATILNTVSVAFQLPEAALAGSVKLTFHDGTSPHVLTLATSQETAGAHGFSFDVTNPLGSPEIISGTALPEGIYAVTLSYQDGLGNQSASSTPRTNVRIATTPLHLWKLVNLGDANAPDLGNPDFDNLVTLAEYGLNSLPQTTNAAPVVTRFAYAEGLRLRVFLQRDPAHSDVTVEVQASGSPAGPWDTVATSTLGSPFSGPGYVIGDDATPGVHTIEVRDTVNLAGIAARYLRMRITH